MKSSITFLIALSTAILLSVSAPAAEWSFSPEGADHITASAAPVEGPFEFTNNAGCELEAVP